MPRQAGISIENNFTRGLITEATGLNFPENACVETYDCIFDRTGEVYRRPGIELEDNFDVKTLELDDNAITEYVWRTVALTGQITFLVLQVGSVINFWQMDEIGGISPNLKEFYVNLDDYQIAGQTTNEENASFSSGNGQLFITHPRCDPIFVEYDQPTDTIEQKRIEVKVRDLVSVPNYARGTETIMEHSLRPNDSQFGVHQFYNLMNRGWGEQRFCTWNRKIFNKDTPLHYWRYPPYDFVAGGLATVLFLLLSGAIYAPAIAGMNLFDSRHDWPSDSDQLVLMKQPMIPFLDEDGNVLPPIPPLEAWSMLGIEESLAGNAPAPRGRFIYSAWNIDRKAKVNEYKVIAIPGHPDAFDPYLVPFNIENETSGNARPSQTAFHAGRVWYADVQAPKYSSRIYFSRILEADQHYGQCYQTNDPSDAESPSNDILPSDGGIIVIPEAAKIHKIMPLGSNMMVFASNGVWAISRGSDGTGFTAIDYEITKISDFGAISPHSFVMANGAVFWWNAEGIFTIQADQQGKTVVVSITKPTIQDFYDEIPASSRRWAKGAFNKSEHVIQWVYRSTEPTNIKERFQYDRILNLNLDTGAFYPWTISDACLYVAGIFSTTDTGTRFEEEPVTDDGVDVTDDDVVVTDRGRATVGDLETQFKYLVFNECDADLSTPGEDATLTYDRQFYGTVGTPEIGIGIVNSSPAHNGVIKGEDGKYYFAISGEDGLDTTNVSLIRYNADGSAVQVRYPLSQYTQDINNEVGVGFATVGWWYKVFPLPYTQYFYVMSGQGYNDEPGEVLGGAIMAGLYKINGAGAIEFQNAAQIWTGSFYDAFFFGAVGHGSVVACDYESYAPDPLNRPLIIVNMTAIAGMYVYRLPAANEFIADSGDIGVVTTDLWTGYADPFPSANGGASLFANFPGITILPTPGGARLFRYVNYATAQTHLGSASFEYAPINTLAPSSPTGFVMSSPINTVSWSIVNDSFKDLNGNNLVPFADLLLDRDGTDPGSEDSNYLNDWVNPTHQYDANTNTHYLIWSRAYRPTEDNQTSLGTYRTILMQTWNPSTAVATEIVDPLSGNPLDTLEDLGAADRYGSYPFQMMAFMDTSTNDIFFFNYYPSLFNPGRNWALSKFGSFNPGEEAIPGETNMSFAEFKNFDYTDWTEVTAGVDYTSYFVTGTKVRGEAMRKFQSNYLQIYCNNLDVVAPSTFDVHGRWDYATHGSTGRWNSVQRIQMPDDEYSSLSKRLKMRGHGKALQLKVSSITEQPFNIVGFSIYETTNAVP